MIRRILIRVGSLYWLAALALLLPGSAAGQIPTEVRLDDRGTGSTFVRARTPARVEVALWTSREDGDSVQLVRRVESATIWPQTFELAAGGRQTVRLHVPPDSFPPGGVLRLETTLTPRGTGSPVPAEGVDARLRVVTRFLTKVHLPTP